MAKALDTDIFERHLFDCLNVSDFYVQNGSRDGCTDNTSDFDIFLEYWYVFFIRDIVCIPPILFGNILILVSLRRFRGLCKEAQAILFRNLAVSDLLLGVVVFPMDIALRVDQTLIRSLNYCSIYLSALFIIVGASVLNLFLLSLERFYAIVRPLKHLMVVTKRRVYLLIILIWCSLLTFGLLPVIGWNGDENMSETIFPVKHILDETYLYFMGATVVVTMMLNTVFFFIIVKVVAAKYAARIQASKNRRTNITTTIRRDIRNTSITLILSGLCIIFWGPFSVLSIIPNPSTSLEVIVICFGNFGMINSTLNWIVYGCRSKRFRTAFTNLLSCRRKSSYNQSEYISNVIVPTSSANSFQ